MRAFRSIGKFKSAHIAFGVFLVSTTSVLAQVVGSDASNSPVSPIQNYPGSGVPGSDRPSQLQAPMGPITEGASVQSPSYGNIQRAPGTAAAAGAATTGPQTFSLGGFTVTPSITAGSYFDDNVFATTYDRKSDVAFFARPTFTAVTQGQNYSVQASGYVEGRKYLKYDSEDQVNGGASIAGLVRPDATTQLRGGFDYIHGHEDRGTGESALFSLDKPVSFDQIDGALALDKRFGRVWTSVGTSAVGVAYQNDTSMGVPVNQDYRNILIPTLSGRIGYVVAPLTSVYVDVTGNKRSLKDSYLSSSGYRVSGGLLFEPGPGARVRGTVYGGYIYQDYNGALLETVSTWTAGGALAFLLRDDLTLTAQGSREAKESGLDGGASVVESSAGLRLDYQATNRLVIGGGATYLSDSFQGLTRTDKYISPLASIKYTVSPTITVGLDYRMLDYRPDALPIEDVSGFERNVVMASVNGVF